MSSCQKAGSVPAFLSWDGTGRTLGDPVNAIQTMSATSAPPMLRHAQPQGDGLYLIDTDYVRPGLAAAHLLVDDGHAAFIDTGPGPAAPRLLAALDEVGLAPEQVDYLFLTHVHLDHAGGAGQMMRALPNARAVLHPRGAPHLVDPAKLIAGSIAVYGETLYRQLYGELLPIPADRVLTTEDGMRLELGRRTFEFIDAPGHARHHHCPIDLDRRDVYAGDNFGICYRDLDTAAGPFMLPTTTPVQFDPEAMHRTIDRLMAYQPRRIVQTHFGPVTDLERLARDLHASVDELVRIARRFADAPDRTQRIREAMFDYFSARLDEHGYTGDLATRHRLIDEDVNLNTQGLEVWLSKQ
jgi:glyoxylase-like metal-dependent hydrolase (beta-lactamase superfamily II)